MVGRRRTVGCCASKPHTRPRKRCTFRRAPGTVAAFAFRGRQGPGTLALRSVHENDCRKRNAGADRRASADSAPSCRVPLTRADGIQGQGVHDSVTRPRRWPLCCRRDGQRLGRFASISTVRSTRGRRRSCSGLSRRGHGGIHLQDRRGDPADAGEENQDCTAFSYHSPHRTIASPRRPRQDHRQNSMT